MDTLEFLTTLLPSAGGKFLVAMNSKGTSHVFCETTEQLVARTANIDQREGVTAYFALATYRDAFVMAGEKKTWRTAENRLQMQSFWLDIDCGEEKAAVGKGYSTKRAGAEAVKAFCTTVGLPFPLLVDSGNGLHAYWPLSEAIDDTTWQPIANRFKALTTQEGLLADPSRTADGSSILRPVGSHNKKGAQKLVKVIVKHQQVLSPSAFNKIISSKLADSVSSSSLFGEAVPEYLRATQDDSIQAHAREFRPADANLIADKCRQVGMFRDTGTCDYPVWFGIIGILKHCENGEATAHKWSAKSEHYEENETQKKFDTYSKGPMTCDKFRADNPAGCEGCEFAGSVKSPIALGNIAPPVQAAEVTTVVEDGVVKEVTIPALPRGFKFSKENNVIFGTGKNEDGIVVDVPFSRTLFYLTDWVYIDEEHFMGARVHEPNGEIRSFMISSEALGIGGSALKAELGRAAITLTPNKDAIYMVTSYLTESLNLLKAAAPSKKQLAQLGWNADRTEFALGRYVIGKGGAVRMAELSGFAERGSTLGPVGKLEDWVSGVDELYNKVGMEPFQYAVCAALGSLLTPLAKQAGYFGIPLAFTGTRSGTGKTTVCRVALSTMGDPSTLIFNGLRNGTTENALYASFAALQNIPVLLDEVTNISGEEMSRVVYSIANGKNKVRLLSSGKAGPTYNWASASYMTANVDLSATLCINRQNTEAEALRFIEVYMDEMPPLPMTSRTAAQEALRRIEGAAGTPAMEFLTYCIANPKDVQAALNNAETFVGSHSGEGTQERRFYIGHATCTLAAASIMKKLGLITFDLDAVNQWIVDYITQRCAAVKEVSLRSCEDVMSQFINDNSRHIIVSQRYADLREANTIAETLPQGVIAPFIGRMVVGAPTGIGSLYSGRFIIKKAELQKYCLEHRYSYKKLIGELEQIKCLRTNVDDNRVDITKGIISQPPMQLRCIVVDVEKMFNGSNKPMLTIVATQAGLTEEDVPAKQKGK